MRTTENNTNGYHNKFGIVDHRYFNGKHEKEDNGNKLQQHMQLCICHHRMLLTSSIITELDSVFNISKKSRRECIFDQHLSWNTFAQ